MCAILDNSARDEVFGDTPTERGLAFHEWLNAGRGRLVIGGTKLRAELAGNRRQPGSVNFRKWLPEAIRLGRLAQWDDNEVDNVASVLEEQGVCQSDDPHVVALAQASGARLLYTVDRALQQDFTNPVVIANPRGKIYPTERYRDFLNHRRNRNLCGRG